MDGFLQGLIGLVLEAGLRRNPDDRDFCLGHGGRRLGLFPCGHDKSLLAGRRLLLQEFLTDFWHTKCQIVKLAVFKHFRRVPCLDKVISGIPNAIMDRFGVAEQ
jgi:hypothetical protein